MQPPIKSVLTAVSAYLSWADCHEVEAVLECAQNGNAPAQFIVGCSLASAHSPQHEAAKKYVQLAAAQGYKPAVMKLAKTSEEHICELTY